MGTGCRDIALVQRHIREAVHVVDFVRVNRCALEHDGLSAIVIVYKGKLLPRQMAVGSRKQSKHLIASLQGGHGVDNGRHRFAVNPLVCCGVDPAPLHVGEAVRAELLD